MFRASDRALLLCLALAAMLPACGGKSSESQRGGSAGANGAGSGGASGSEPGGVSCGQVVTFYEELVSEAKGCDPHSPNLCTLRVSDELGCGCETFVNPNHWDQSLAMAYQSHYSALACNATGNCGPCRSPLRGVCSVMNGCEDAFDPAPGRGCKVDGSVYADGASSLPDPTSCNTCTCRDGELSCTNLDCPEPCPKDTKLAKSCAQCGSRLDCDVVEHACQPTCSDTCSSGATCVDGACVPDCIRKD